MKPAATTARAAASTSSCIPPPCTRGRRPAARSRPAAARAPSARTECGLAATACQVTARYPCPNRCARARGNPRPVPLRSAYSPGAWQQHRRPDRAVGRVQRARPGPDHDVLLGGLRAGDPARREPVGHPLRGSAAVREGLAQRFLGLPDVHYGDDEHWVCWPARCLAMAAHGDHDRGRARASAKAATCSTWTTRGASAQGLLLEDRPAVATVAPGACGTARTRQRRERRGTLVTCTAAPTR